MSLYRSAGTRVVIREAATTPGDSTWFYFKGNGHERGRNGPYDRIEDRARYFYLPTVVDGRDTLPWRNGFSLSWQFIPVRQAAYYTTFFYSASQDTDFFDLRDTHGYVGCHPYPHSGVGEDGDDFRLHKWEISVDGQDRVGEVVPYGTIHTQAFRCAVSASGESQLRFFTRISGPDVAGQPRVDSRHTGSYADAPAHPYKAMVFGNAPWWRDHQHERLSGYIRRIKVFSGTLSDDDLLAESLSDTLVTERGRELVWWGKVNPSSPDDLGSDFVGAGGMRLVARWIDDSRAEVIRSDALGTHHAYLSASTIGNLLHMERG